jgi:hypothetical protein
LPVNAPVSCLDQKFLPSNTNKLSHPIKDLIKVIAMGLKSIAPLKFLLLLSQQRFDKPAVITEHNKEWLFL